MRNKNIHSILYNDQFLRVQRQRFKSLIFLTLCDTYTSMLFIYLYQNICNKKYSS